MKSWRGQGGSGAVYRAERVGWRHAEAGALKVSLSVRNWRMAREVELLSRLSHPSIPRLLDRGTARQSSSGEYPYFVMQWVEGTPLYAWGEQNTPTGKQVCGVLARLARALEAVHAAGAVHRDVKGDNVLVQADGVPMLTDFGSCHFEGAERLTWQSLPPVTPAYLSPQAVLFYIHSHHHPEGYYAPAPADDLYALGVTAYRLVMGQYPPPLEAKVDEKGAWRVISPDFRSLLESNPRVEPRLREVLLRLLSEAPEARGTAAQVAEALEAMAGEPPRVPAAPKGSEPPERVRPPARARAWEPWLALAAVAGFAVLLWSVAPVQVKPRHVAASPPRASAFQQPDADTSAVGDTSPTEAQASTPPPTQKKPVAQEPLPEPRPGQIRPDKRGQCPGRKQVPINGGCWVELLSMTAEECVESGSVLFKGKCYAPIASPKQPQPTSSPPEAR